MVTTVTSTISNTVASDYSTLQAWEDAAPADLVAADIIWKGEIIAADNFSDTSGTVLTIEGSTSDATHYKELTVRDGFSIFDDPDNPLRYDESKGASIRVTTGLALSVNESYARVSRLQITSGVTTQAVLYLAVSSEMRFTECLVESTKRCADFRGADTRVANCIFIERAASANDLVIINVSGSNVNFYNCTFITPSDLASSGRCILTVPGVTVNSTNCAFYGSFNISTGTGTANFTTCATDLGSPPSGVTTVTFANAKFVKGDNTRSDFRIMGTSSLKNAGTTSATFASTDIFGVSRPQGASYDIGCYEHGAVITAERTISLSGTPDYSTLQAWEDAAPTDLTTDNIIWKGVIQASTDIFTAGVTVSGGTTDATRYKELTAKDGASFIDHADVATNPLRYDSSKGCAIELSTNVACISGTENYFRVSRIQMNNTNAARTAPIINMTSNGLVIDKCIVQSSASGTRLALLTSASPVRAAIKNSLFSMRVASTQQYINISGLIDVVNCTMVTPSDISKISSGVFYNASADGSIMTNCAIFGCTSAAPVAGGANITISNCYTDGAITNPGFTVIPYNTSSGSGFENITDASRNFRIKHTSTLLNAGQNTSYTSEDIFDTERSSGQYDVGAHEFDRSTLPANGLAYSHSLNRRRRRHL